MQTKEQLLATIKRIAVPGKGILAADESHQTIGKRFQSISLENTTNHRRDYREMLFSTPNLANYISAVILFEETLTQAGSKTEKLVDILRQQGIEPGIKVDKGLVTLNSAGEKYTQGCDFLIDRLQQYQQQGATFAKWRAVYHVSDTLPSWQAIKTNAYGLARYTNLCQQVGVVPIVEPEILMDGTHTISRCQHVTEIVLRQVFQELAIHDVLLEGIILKPSMVIAGNQCPEQANINEVAQRTLEVLLRTVPAAVPSINFLSGGQSATLATAHLAQMNAQQTTLPWQLSFSYGRALQAPSLAVWKGQQQQVEQAQMELSKHAKANSLASLGKKSD